MASTKEYLDFVLGQIKGIDITYKKMMGEYLLYANGVLFGGIYDDRLLIKPIEKARELLPNAEYAIQQIILFVILRTQLYRMLSVARDAMMSQLRFGRRIHGIAAAAYDLLRAGGGGSNDQTVGNSLLFRHILENKLRHRAAADIAVADK